MCANIRTWLFRPVLEVLDASEAFEPPVHHDTQSGAQSFTLLHAREDNTVYDTSFMSYTLIKTNSGRS